MIKHFRTLWLFWNYRTEFRFFQISNSWYQSLYISQFYFSIPTRKCDNEKHSKFGISLKLLRLETCKMICLLCLARSYRQRTIVKKKKKKKKKKKNQKNEGKRKTLKTRYSLKLIEKRKNVTKILHKIWV